MLNQPDDILYEIFNQCGIGDIKELSRVNKKLHQIGNDDKLWRRKYDIISAILPINPMYDNYKQSYLRLMVMNVNNDILYHFINYPSFYPRNHIYWNNRFNILYNEKTLNFNGYCDYRAIFERDHDKQLDFRRITMFSGYTTYTLIYLPKELTLRSLCEKLGTFLANNDIKRKHKISDVAKIALLKIPIPQNNSKPYELCITNPFSSPFLDPLIDVTLESSLNTLTFSVIQLKY